MSCFADRLALVVTSPSFDSAESVFGHSFLMLYSGEFPDLNSKTISFVANTGNQQKNLNYLLKGLNGGFNTEIRVEEFSQKYFQYVLVENRSLYFYELSLTAQQIKLINRTMPNQRMGNYKFVTNNCAHSILSFLEKNGYETDHTGDVYLTPNETAKFISKYIKSFFVVRNPRAYIKDKNTLEVLSFYSKGSYDSESLLKTNQGRSATAAPTFTVTDEIYFKDRKLSYSFSKNENFLKFSPIYRDYLDLNFAELSLNKVELLSVQLISKNTAYELGKFTLINFEKNSFHKLFPLNYAIELIRSREAYGLKLRNGFKLSLGTSASFFSAKMPIFSDIKLVSNEEENSRYFFRLRGFLTDNNRIKQYLTLNHDLLSREQTFDYDFNVNLNSSFSLSFNYDSKQLSKILLMYSF